MDKSGEWLRRANSSLHLATALETDEEIDLEDRCFQLQQSAEKALKAVLVSQSLQFPKTHDLVSLANLLEKRLEMPAWAASVGDLNDYAVATRYPGDYTPVTMHEYEIATGLVRAIVEWASSMLENP